MTIRADKVKVGDVLIPLVDYGKVESVATTSRHVAITFDDGEVVICPAGRVFNKLTNV